MACFRMSTRKNKRFSMYDHGMKLNSADPADPCQDCCKQLPQKYLDNVSIVPSKSGNSCHESKTARLLQAFDWLAESAWKMLVLGAYLMKPPLNY